MKDLHVDAKEAVRRRVRPDVEEEDGDDGQRPEALDFRADGGGVLVLTGSGSAHCRAATTCSSTATVPSRSKGMIFC